MKPANQRLTSEQVGNIVKMVAPLPLDRGA